MIRSKIDEKLLKYKEAFNELSNEGMVVVFTYSPLRKAFEKQTKTIEEQGQKQVRALRGLKPEEQTKSIEGSFPEDYESVEIKNELNKIKEYEKQSIETIWLIIIQAKNHWILEFLK